MPGKMQQGTHYWTDSECSAPSQDVVIYYTYECECCTLCFLFSSELEAMAYNQLSSQRKNNRRTVCSAWELVASYICTQCIPDARQPSSLSWPISNRYSVHASPKPSQRRGHTFLWKTGLVCPPYPDCLRSYRRFPWAARESLPFLYCVTLWGLSSRHTTHESEKGRSTSQHTCASCNPCARRLSRHYS